MMHLRYKYQHIIFIYIYTLYIFYTLVQYTDNDFFAKAHSGGSSLYGLIYWLDLAVLGLLRDRFYLVSLITKTMLKSLGLKTQKHCLVGIIHMFISMKYYLSQANQGVQPI